MVNGVQPGDEILVYADLPPAVPFKLKIAGVPVTPAGALAPAPRPLLERAWVRARIARILEQRDGVASTDRDLADALKQQAIDLSIRNRVLCPFTSLLVLETERDYARFGIERRALADILTVGPEGITLLHRTEIAAPPRETFGEGEEDSALPAQARAMPKGKRPLAKNDFEKEAKKTVASAENERPGLRNEVALEEEESPLANEGSAPVAAPAARPAGAAAPHPARAQMRREASDDMIDGLTGGSAGGLASDAPAHAAPTRQPIAGPRVPADRFAGRGAAVAVASAPRSETAPVVGPFKEVTDLLDAKHAREALARAFAWRSHDPGDVLALVAIGECYEALGDVPDAARAYGSIIDLFPGRADMRRFAGERLERLAGTRALALAIDTYRQAVEQRPDHPAGHHLLGFALLKSGHAREAFEALAVGAAQRYPEGRFRGVDRILREDLGLAAAAWTHAEPGRAAEIRERLARAGGTAETGASIRFILNWETDANDVDFHIHDARGGHAFYSQPRLDSGGELYADVTTGYGPECFTIRGPAAGRAAPYHLQAHYYSRGPMGYGMGKLQIIEHDGRGNLRFDERPFIIMQDGAFVDLGEVGPMPVGVRPVTVAHKAPARQPLAPHVWAVVPGAPVR